MKTRFIFSKRSKAMLSGSALALAALSSQLGCDADPQLEPAHAPAPLPAPEPGLADAPAERLAASSSGSYDDTGYNLREVVPPKAPEVIEVKVEAPAASPSSVSSAAQIPVTIEFQGRVGNKDFECGQIFDGVGLGNSSVKPNDFRFYVHNLRLVNDQGQDVALTLDERSPWQTQNVALVDFENNEGDCKFKGDAAINKVVVGSVPAGNYQGLRFTLGVPSSLNHLDPATTGGPFQAGGMAWSWMMGFKFLSAEVRTTDSTSQLGLFHLGSKACSNNGQGFECAKPNRAEVFLPNFKVGQDQVVADLGAIFANSDLSATRECHSSGDDCAPMFQQAGVSWETGAPLPQQSIFSSARRQSVPAPVTGGSGLLLLGLGLFSIAGSRRGRR